MIKINIEELINAVEISNYANSDYQIADRTRKECLCESYNYYMREEHAVRTLINVLEMDREQIERLYIAARAVKKWQIKTHYEKVISRSLGERLERFIFS